MEVVSFGLPSVAQLSKNGLRDWAVDDEQMRYRADNTLV